ncbi:MAG TPA: DUF4357 domain-containing protein [Rhodobacteraceae bacterium]|nr:DUF4357 domain-containing protein [Paracoccaceae bacterium]
MTSTSGRSLELFFVDGQPDGLLTAELFNWTGHVLQVPRTRLKEALRRTECGFTGVYILLGDREAGPTAYIGESEDIGARLRNHALEKEWWDRAIIITTAANNLHKAHVKYLESRLVELAIKAGNTPLENGNTPARSSLSEAAQTNMEVFINNLSVVLPAIRVDLLVDRTRPKIPDEDTKTAGQTAFILTSERAGIHARAVLKEGELIVQAASQVRSAWVGKGSWDKGYRKLREHLIETGIIDFQEGTGVFTENYAFSSPSAAAAVIVGRAANGRTEWHVEGRKQTYGEWEEEQLRTEGSTT